jgi:hypothetical protein
MRDNYNNYEDSPAAAREAGLRRLGRLTWRTTQLGALAAVGFAIVFARTAPAPVANAQPAKPTEPAKATAARSHAPARHKQQPRRVAGTHTAGQPTAQQTTQAAAQPAPQPTSQAPAPAPTPSLAPPTTPPAPAPSTSSAVPTATSTSHGGG